MNFFVISLILSCLTLFLLVPDSGKVRCTCRPSPPGGVTECQSGQNAVCTVSGGVCKGSCISLSTDLQPLQYSAELLSLLFEEKVRVQDLEKDPETSKKLLAEIMNLSKKGKTGTLIFNGRKYPDICIGLTKAAIDKLKLASKALPASKKIHIPAVPRIKW